MPCAGNSSLLCGGPSGLTLYNNTQWALMTAAPSQPTGPVTVPSAGRYQYVDCHTEVSNGRALSGSAIVSNDMTVQYCAGNCTGYAFFGVEYGQECYCGNTLNTGSVTATDQRCSMTCAGNSSTICGGPNGLSLYKLVVASLSSSISRSSTSSILASTSVNPSQIANSTTTTAPSIAPSSHSSNTIRATTSSSFAMFISVTTSSTSSKSSVSTITTLSLSSASLPTSTLILIDTSISNPTTSVRSTSSANATATSGINVSSPNATSLRTPPSSSGRTSATSASGTLASSSWTVSTSRSESPAYVSTSGAASYVSSTGSGTTIRSSTTSISSLSILVTSTTARASSVSATSVSSGFSTIFVARTSTTSATFASTSSSSATTGISTLVNSVTSQTSTQPRISASTSNSGSGFVSGSTSTPPRTSSTYQGSVTSSSSSSKPSSLFTTNISTTSSSTRLTTTTTARTTTTRSMLGSSTTTTSPIPSSTTIAADPFLPNVYIGCAAELSNIRLLSSASFTNSSMTIASCLSFCTSQFMPLAGLEYGRECYCSSSLPPNTPLNQTGCTMACAGDGDVDVTQPTCGGRSRLSIFNNTLLSPPGPKPVISPPSPSASPGGSVYYTYAYQGCFTDPSSSQRALSGYSASDSAMTQEKCVATCAGRGFKFAGVEYARECYCSDTLATAGGSGSGNGKSLQVGEGDCGMPCAGDKSEVCGGSSRIGVWMASSSSSSSSPSSSPSSPSS
ncbi:hypothetical protein PV08_00646 [Exophiala spinifera]|uniref:WSC domain-containing protein n=1 Tax=Exophiala spinifera TaxID=91928 RepID=A0A0D1YXS7_9EURO|nr:uncharacterized protein PV08_00646 [Exophiala spinifera]KIW20071.1 hypothetical protein PV08_00646 [Exophiala spinifera]